MRGGVIKSQDELNTIYQQLELDPNDIVRVMIIDYYPEVQSENLDLFNLRTKIRTSIQNKQTGTVYLSLQVTTNSSYPPRQRLAKHDCG